MLNKNGERELAYVVKIDAIEPIVGSDNCEAAIVGGWRIMVRKETFRPGDLAIYFEIDSKVDTTRPEFAFLEKKGGKVKTQRYTFGGKGLMISQGLLMAPADFGWTVEEHNYGESIHTPIEHNPNNDSRFLTKELGVTYADVEDNSRKANSQDKYKKMAQRNSKLFSKKPFRWLMKRSWGRKLLFLFFGKKKDKRTWPEWVKKTDEERCQNQPWRFGTGSTQKWIVSEKIDGTSTTATYRVGRKYGFYICSRNVVFDKPDKKCFYETNVYTEMAEKYKFEDVLKDIVKKHHLEWATIQGETYGAGIQKRDYSMQYHDFAAFNLIFSDRGRLNSYEAKNILAEYGIPWVPLIRDDFILPDTVDEMLAYAEGASVVDGLPREGFVLRSQDGADSFKAVSNSFLLKYHG